MTWRFCGTCSPAQACCLSAEQCSKGVGWEVGWGALLRVALSTSTYLPIPLQALRFFEHAKVDPAFDAPALWDKMAQCQTLLGRREDALGLYQTVVDGAPCRKQALVCSNCTTESCASVDQLMIAGLGCAVASAESKRQLQGPSALAQLQCVKSLRHVVYMHPPHPPTPSPSDQCAWGVADASAVTERRLEAAMALAELHDAAGRRAAALQALAGAPEAGPGEVALALTLRRAELWLRLGRPVRPLT